MRKKLRNVLAGAAVAGMAVAGVAGPAQADSQISGFVPQSQGYYACAAQVNTQVGVLQALGYVTYVEHYCNPQLRSGGWTWVIYYG